MTSGNFDKSSAHDGRSLDGKIRIPWHLGIFIKTKTQHRFPVFHGNLIHHTYVHAGIMDGVARLDSFCFFEIAGHMKSAFTENHCIPQLDDNDSKKQNPQQRKGPYLCFCRPFQGASPSFRKSGSDGSPSINCRTLGSGDCLSSSGFPMARKDPL